MSMKAIAQAKHFLGIKDERLYELPRPDWKRLSDYLRVHYGIDLDKHVILHNDVPHVEGVAAWKRLDNLVFRGSGKSYQDIADGFSAVGDNRFDKPCIIRDKWQSKSVTTHMQTKAVLAWSKSFYVALEYAYGCIRGDFGNEVPGYLHFCHVEMGLDVVDAVRAWENDNPGTLPGNIDPGKQHEIITPTVPRQRVLATWELRKSRLFKKYGAFYVHAKVVHAGNFASVMPLYTQISNAVPEGPDRAHEYAALGMYVDRHYLI